MKPSIFITLLAAAGALTASGATRTATEAEAIARQFACGGMLRAPGAGGAAMTLVAEATSATGEADYYVFDRQGGGFVVVGGDDRVLDVWGYSDAGAFATGDEMPTNLQWWLDEYRSQLEWLRAHPEARPRRAETLTTSVPAMLSSMWGQGKPYNNDCPTIPSGGYISNGYRAPAGCVATAMAQIMNFYQWPSTGVGSHSYSTDISYGYTGSQSYTATLSADFSESVYDWDNMKNQYRLSYNYSTVYVRDASSASWTVATAAQQSAVAKLMSDVGIAVDMGYGNSSSGASSSKVATAMKNYFGYSPDIRRLARDDYSGDWDAMLRAELDAGRPIYYSGHTNKGYNDGGHAFVFDGYDTRGYFHVNWGWSGSSDGYFASSLLNPDDQGTGSFEGGYNTIQNAIVGIEPFDEATAVRLTATPTLLDFGTVESGVDSTLVLSLQGKNIDGAVLATVSGTGADCYTLSATSLTAEQANCGASIAVTFRSTAPGRHTATLTLSGGGLNKPVTVSLAANVSGFNITPEELDFGTVELGSTNRLVLALQGTNLKSKLNLALSGDGAAHYKLSSSSITATSIARGANIIVTYTPTVPGRHDAELTLTCADFGEPIVVPVTGFVEGAIDVESVTLSATELTLTVGESATLTATVTPGDASNQVLRWATTDTEVLTVTNSGRVTARAAGTATVTATTTDGTRITASCLVTVRPDGIAGDVNGDGVVDVADVNALINIILDISSRDDLPGDANVDGSDDGVVDVGDVNAVINIILAK